MIYKVLKESPLRGRSSLYIQPLYKDALQHGHWTLYIKSTKMAISIHKIYKDGYCIIKTLLRGRVKPYPAHFIFSRSPGNYGITYSVMRAHKSRYQYRGHSYRGTKVLVPGYEGIRAGVRRYQN